MTLKECTIGAIGLGEMGGGIAANLVSAGYSVIGYDLKADAVHRLVEAGGRSAENGEEIVARCDIILTCVEGRDSIHLADNVLLPNARPGQIFIDHSTVPAPETRSWVFEAPRASPGQYRVRCTHAPLNIPLTPHNAEWWLKCLPVLLRDEQPRYQLAEHPQ